jgi:hypothetical protein
LCGRLSASRIIPELFIKVLAVRAGLHGNL